MEASALLPKAGPKTFHEFIYGLRCPNTGLVRYVGRTTSSLRARLSNHMGQLNNKKATNAPFLAWKQSLRDSGKRPEIILLVAAPRWDAASAERKWTRWFQRAGNPMLNIRNLLAMESARGYDLWELNNIADNHGLEPSDVSTAANVCIASCIAFMAGTRLISQPAADAVAQFLYSLPAKRLPHDGRSNIHTYAPYFLDEYLKNLYTK